MPDRPTIDHLRMRTSYKWRSQAADVLPMFVAEMDLPLAEPVARAITDAIAIGDTGYPWGEQYEQAFAEFAAGRWGWDTGGAERAAMMADVMSGVLHLLDLIAAETVVVATPAYPMFFHYLRAGRRRIVEVPLTGAQRLDLPALDAAFAAAGPGAAFLLCSPHNPTGTLHSREELTTLAASARAHGVRVISDEIHAPLVSPGRQFTPYLAVPGSQDAFALLSASKAWNLAALKAAVAVAGEDAAEELSRLPLPATHGHSHLGVIAQTAALRSGGDWLDEVNRLIRDNRRLLADLLSQRLPAVRYQPGEATYLAWLDCRELGLDDEPATVFAERGRVAFGPGPTFGAGGAGHVRTNLATPPELVVETVDRMVAAVGGE